MSLDSCDLIQSQFTLASDYAAGVALDFIAEVAEQLLPAAEPSELFFRLMLAILENLRARQSEGIWEGVTYFLLWAVKLSGLLPELAVSEGSRAIAEEMLHTPVSQLAARTWTRATAADLRRMLVRGIEEHIERRLITLPLLESATAL